MNRLMMAVFFIVLLQGNAKAAEACVIMTISSGTTRIYGTPVGEVILQPKVFEDISECNFNARETLELIINERTGIYWGIAQSYFIQCFQIETCRSRFSEEPSGFLYTKQDWLNGRSYEEALEDRRRILQE